MDINDIAIGKTGLLSTSSNSTSKYKMFDKKLYIKLVGSMVNELGSVHISLHLNFENYISFYH